MNGRQGLAGDTSGMFVTEVGTSCSATIGFSERVKAMPTAERMATVPAVAILTQRVTVTVERACSVRWKKQ